MSKAAAIRQAKQSTWVAVPCPEWQPDGSEGPFVIYVQTMSGQARNELEKMAAQGKTLKRDPFKFREFVLKECCYEEIDGAKVFAGFSTEELQSLHTAALERCVDAALRVSGLTAKELDELSGN